jgi:hypothetical protein
MTGKTILIIFILIGAAVVVAAKPAPLEISVERAGSAYRISLTFHGDADGSTRRYNEGDRVKRQGRQW